MKTIFFVRHGESDANVGTHFSPADAPLTAKGRQQAAFIAERTTHLPVDVLISSTMGRAKETAEYIAEAIKLPIEYSELMVERKFPSALVGLEKKSPEGKKMWDDWTKSAAAGGPRVLDGENFDDIKERSRTVIRLLEKRPEDNILIVSHGFFMRFLALFAIYRDELTPAIFAPIHFGLRVNNTGLTVLHYDPNDKHKDWWVSVWNDHAHLG